MRYIGSKASTITQVSSLVGQYVPTGTLCDPFGGIGVAGANFKALGYAVHTGDILTFAHYFQIARVQLSEPPLPASLAEAAGASTPSDVCDLLNNATPVRSVIHREFSQRRMYFTPQNAMKIDAARILLKRWRKAKLIDGTAAAYYSACFIDAVDRVANTAGTYYAHLKMWTRKSMRPFRIKPLPTTNGPIGCTASLEDAASLARSRPWDVLYLDPPHNSRDYGGYYHLPESLATERRLRPSGLSGVDASRARRSDFTRPHVALNALNELLTASAFRLLVIHYSDNGLIQRSDLRILLRRFGTVEEHLLDAMGYSTRGVRTTQHRVYLVHP